MNKEKEITSKINVWWTYSMKQEAVTVSYNQETKENVAYTEIPIKIRDDGPSGMGKYSTLQDAIQGFLNDEVSDDTIVKIEYDENDDTKFKFTATQWTDTAGQPVDENVKSLWRRGKIKFLYVTKIEAIFFCHSEWQASLRDYSIVMDRFKDRVDLE